MDADLTAPEGSVSRVIGGSHRNARVAVPQEVIGKPAEKDTAEGMGVESAAPRTKPVNRPSTSKSAIVYNASQVGREG